MILLYDYFVLGSPDIRSFNFFNYLHGLTWHILSLEAEVKFFKNFSYILPRIIEFFPCMSHVRHEFCMMYRTLLHMQGLSCHGCWGEGCTKWDEGLRAALGPSRSRVGPGMGGTLWMFHVGRCPYSSQCSEV